MSLNTSFMDILSREGPLTMRYATVVATIIMAALVCSGCSSSDAPRTPASSTSDTPTTSVPSAPAATQDHSMLYPETSPHKPGVKQITPSNDGKAYLKSTTFECDGTNIGITVPFGKTVKYGATVLKYDYQLTGGSLFSQTVVNIIITDGAEFRPVAAIVDSLDSYGSHIDEQVVVITPKDLATGQLRMESDDFGPYGSYISDVTFCVPAL